jgi:hypothetical protein
MRLGVILSAAGDRADVLQGRLGGEYRQAQTAFTARLEQGDALC